MQDQINGAIVIRKVQEQDLEQILVIENQVAIVPWPKETFIDCIELYNAVVVTVDQVIVGYGVIVIYNSINEAHILNIGIDPLWQRIGIGSKLLNYLINLSNETLDTISNKIFLEVHKDNIPAINLYKKFNFVEIGIRKNYYNTKNGRQDAVVLVFCS